MNLRKKIYIQVHKGYFVSRIIGNSNDLTDTCEGLIHPRTLAGDWEKIELGLKSIIRKHTNFMGYVFKPILLVHLVPKLEGGYSTSEMKIFNLLAISAGAHFCYMCLDKYDPLSDKELKDLFQYL